MRAAAKKGLMNGSIFGTQTFFFPSYLEIFFGFGWVGGLAWVGGALHSTFTLGAFEPTERE